MTKVPAIIRDGYTRDGYVAERVGIHPSLEFRYRPMVKSERLTMTQAELMNAEETAKHHADVLAKKILSWDAQECTGPDTFVAVKPTAELIKCLQPELFERVYGIVAGYVPSDPKQPGEKVEALTEDVREGN